MSSRVLYCHCAFAQAVPRPVKQDVLRALTERGDDFDAVADLCEMSARKDPALKEFAACERLTLIACYPRALRWEAGQAGKGGGGWVVEEDDRIRLAVLPGGGATEVTFTPRADAGRDNYLYIRLPSKEGAYADLLVPMIPARRADIEQELSLGRDGARHVEVGHTGLDDDPLALEVDLEDPVHPGERDDDAVRDRQRSAGEPRAGAARDEGHAGAGAEPEDRLHLCR